MNFARSNGGSASRQQVLSCSQGSLNPENYLIGKKWRKVKILKKFIKILLYAGNKREPPPPPPQAATTASTATHPAPQAQALKGTQAAAPAPEVEQDLDSGYAWIVLAVMFLMNASVLGTSRAYGLIFENMAHEKGLSRQQAALPFTVMGAVENMAGPLSSCALTLTDSWRTTAVAGSFLVALAHLLACVVVSPAGQVINLGLMGGLGMSLITNSFFQINNAYFLRYRSTAFGIGLCGAAFGTFYISPLCQFILDNHDFRLCYLVLGAVLAPNVPMSLLLRPRRKRAPPAASQPAQPGDCKANALAGIMLKPSPETTPLLAKIIKVIKSPLFHLIWPTQLLFCWFNFVFGMILIDFGVDRGLESARASRLISVWAVGQLIGRLALGPLVDLNYVSYQYSTVLCLTCIGLSTWWLNASNSQPFDGLALTLAVFVLSIFISNLYLLFNGLIMNYMDKALTGLSFGISSFIGSFFLLPRAYIIGYYRDTFRNYDQMLVLFSYVSLVAACVWLLGPSLFNRLRSLLGPKMQPRHSIRSEVEVFSVLSFVASKQLLQ